MSEKSIVIDFHTHPLEYEFYQPSALNWIKGVVSQSRDFDEFYKQYSNPEAVISLFNSSGIDYVVVLAELCPVTTGVCSNEYVGEFCQGRPELIPFASINPVTDRAPGERLKELVSRYGFKGVKLYPTYQYFYPNDQFLYPLYAAAQEMGIPVMFHTGSSVFKGSRLKYGDPLFIDDVAVDFPRLNLVLVHGGRGFWYDRAYFLAKIHENVFLEVAGLPPFNLLKYFPELGKIAHKVLYGSDWPGVSDLAVNLETIRRLPLTDKQKNLILGGNAARILGVQSS